MSEPFDEAAKRYVLAVEFPIVWVTKYRDPRRSGSCHLPFRSAYASFKYPILDGVCVSDSTFLFIDKLFNRECNLIVDGGSSSTPTWSAGP